ncbi:MAG: GNAT family N-acetyltransferase [Clostridia bacterium]
MRDFETKNLKIRKFRMEDVEDVHKNLATESKLTECLGYNIHKTMHETEVMVASLIKEYEMNELIWAIEDKAESEVIGFINAFERSDINKVCKFKFGIALNKVYSGYMEEALKVVIDYLLNVKKFDVLISEFYDGCEMITKIKSNILENVGMTKEAVLHNRKINIKTGLAENKIIYSIFR